MTTWHWEEHGACVGEDPDVFFASDLSGRKRDRSAYAEPLDICSSCPVRRFCLVQAVKDREYRYNAVWGGALPAAMRDIDRLTNGLTTRLRCPKCGQGADLIEFVEQGFQCC